MKNGVISIEITPFFLAINNFRSFLIVIFLLGREQATTRRIGGVHQEQALQEADIRVAVFRRGVDGNATPACFTKI